MLERSHQYRIPVKNITKYVSVTETLGMIGSLLAIIIAIAVGVILPGPKKFVRYIRNRQTKFRIEE